MRICEQGEKIHTISSSPGAMVYSTNINTAQVVRGLALSVPPPTTHSDVLNSPLRIVFETDAPYSQYTGMKSYLMEIRPAVVPSILPPPSGPGIKSGSKPPFSHSAMLPWIAEFIARASREYSKLELPGFGQVFG